MKTILCSGGFDPFHVGHLRYLIAAQKASEWGNVMVALNSDEWLKRKKGYVFMPWDERSQILGSIYCIMGAVFPVNDEDGTVSLALRELKPDIFANGGDRTKANLAEHAVCEELGIKELFNVGGDKIASSSDLMFDVLDKHPLNGP